MSEFPLGSFSMSQVQIDMKIKRLLYTQWHKTIKTRAVLRNMQTLESIFQECRRVAS